MGEWNNSCEDLVLMNEVAHGEEVTSLYLNHDHRKREDIAGLGESPSAPQDFRCCPPCNVIVRLWTITCRTLDPYRYSVSKTRDSRLAKMVH
jgi:hypothetical protein